MCKNKKMKKTVFCVKLKKNLEGLENPPVSGELGKKILQNVSLKAWNNWLSQQTMIINENKLNLMKIDDRLFLKKRMQEYFFSK